VETDSAGTFVIRAWRAGTFRLDVAPPAYQPESVEVQAALGERVEVTIALSAEVTELSAIDVRARSRLDLAVSGLAGFEQRRRWGELLGIGRYLDAEELNRGDDSVDEVLSLGLIAAVEVYASPAELPAEYSGLDSRCGLVAIWTARGAR
jgi:hypothetical protein